MKNIVLAVIATAAVILLGVNYFNVGGANLAKQNEELVPISFNVKELLITINRENKQNLLLLELTVSSVKHEKSYFVANEHLLKNQIIKSINKQPKAYFFEVDFVENAERDIKNAVNSLYEFDIDKVVITKAVYQ